MGALYRYVNTYRFDPKRIDPEYSSASSCADRCAEELRAVLDEEGRRLLRALLDEIALYHAIEQEAMFCSALALARELSELADGA